MHAAIRTYGGAPGLVEGIVARAEEIRGLLRGIDGFQAYYLVRTGPDSAASISVYDDEAGCAASTHAAREWIAANLPDLTVNPPEVAGGPVALEA